MWGNSLLLSFCQMPFSNELLLWIKCFYAILTVIHSPGFSIIQGFHLYSSNNSTAKLLYSSMVLVACGENSEVQLLGTPCLLFLSLASHLAVSCWPEWGMRLCCGELGRVCIKLCPAGNLFSFWKKRIIGLFTRMLQDSVLPMLSEEKSSQLPKLLAEWTVKNWLFQWDITNWSPPASGVCSWEQRSTYMVFLSILFPMSSGCVSAERKIKLESCRCRW